MELENFKLCQNLHPVNEEKVSGNAYMPEVQKVQAGKHTVTNLFFKGLMVNKSIK